MRAFTLRGRIIRARLGEWVRLLPCCYYYANMLYRFSDDNFCRVCMSNLVHAYIVCVITTLIECVIAVIECVVLHAHAIITIQI